MATANRGTSATVDSRGYNTRGTIGTAGNNTNDRYYVDKVLQEAILGHQFARYEWFEQAPIPKKNNERARFRIRNRAKGNVYKIKDGGLASGTSHFRNSTGAVGTAHDTSGNAISDGDELESMSLWADYVEVLPVRYASIYRYSVSQLFSDLDDPVEDATEEMGLMLATQADYQIRSFYDTHGRVITPRAALTALADTDWATTDVFDWEFICKLQADCRVRGYKGPHGMKTIPMIISPDLETSLLLDSDTRTMIQATAERADPMSKTLLDGWLTDIRGFSIYVSARISDVTLNTAGAAFSGTAGYLILDQALGVTSLQDPDYADFLNTSGFQSGPQEVSRDNGSFPRPVQVIHHKPGSSGVNDALNELGTVGEKHAIGMTNLFSERVVRFVCAKGTSTDRASIAGAAAGQAG